MQLIHVLAAGIRGAENGTAVIRARGTAQRANWYETFYGAAPSTQDVALDANGGAAAYVNQLVDVEVLNTDGEVVRSVVAGDAAPGIECITQSFTGVDYDNGASGASKPTTLQSILDRWKASAGATDFNVSLNGGTVPIQTALSGGTVYVNVRAAPYNAAGNGTTDDTSAIQSAINIAALAGGGTVFFPPGTYRTTAALSVPSKVSLLGSGPAGSEIRLDHATADCVTIPDAIAALYQVIAQLTISPSQGNSGSVISVALTGAPFLQNCVLGDSTHTDGDVIDCATGAALLRDCVVLVSAQNARAFVGLQLLAWNTLFLGPPSGNYSPVDGMIVAEFVRLADCALTTSGATSGTSVLLYVDGGSLTATGCSFSAGAGATATAIELADYAGSAPGGVHEAACGFYGVTPYAYTATAVALSRVSLGSRSNLWTLTAVDGDTTLPTASYGTVVAQVTSAAAAVLTLQPIPEGNEVVVIVDNDSGGASGSISFSANVRTVAGSTLAAAELDIYRFKSISVDGTLQLVLMSQQQGL